MEEKEIRPITLTMADGKVYTLEFNRSTVEMAERAGFSREEAVDKMMTFLPMLFFYAFMMHHPTIKREKTDKILFEDLGGLSNAVISRLIDLYDLPYDELISKDDAESKNPRVTVTL